MSNLKCIHRHTYTLNIQHTVLCIKKFANCHAAFTSIRVVIESRSAHAHDDVRSTPPTFLTAILHEPLHEATLRALRTPTPNA